MAYPPVAGPSSGGIGTADDFPAPQVMAAALKAVAKRNGDGSYAYSLPAGLREASWSRVDENLGSEVRRAEAGQGGFYSVESIRIDGGAALVEVAAPKGGHYQLFTVRLAGSGLTGFRVTNIQPWTVRYAAPSANTPVGASPNATVAAEPTELGGS